MWVLVDENDYIQVISKEEYMEGLIHVESVPDKVEIEGKVCFQKYDAATNSIVNVYENLPNSEVAPQPTLEDKINFIYYKQLGVV